MARHAPYLAAATWALFPDQLDGDGRPEGWVHFKLNDLVVHCKGSVSPGANPDQVFEHYSLPAYDDGQSPALDRGTTIKSNKTLVPPGAVLLSKLNPETSRVWLPDPKSEYVKVASTEFLAFQPKAPVGAGLVYSLLRSAPFKAMLEGMVTGTSKSHQRVSPPALLTQNVVVAAPNLFEAFERLAAPLLQAQLANRSHSRTLANTRDLLLPKLISGEIRVKEAEKIAEAAQ